MTKSRNVRKTEREKDRRRERQKDRKTERQKYENTIKMPKIDTLDALDDEMTSILNTL